MTRSFRKRSSIAFLSQPLRQTPQPRQIFWSGFAFFFCGLSGSFEDTRVIASTGHNETHLPQPLQLSSTIDGKKPVVCTGFRNPNFLAAIRASQQQPQQLQIKFTFSCTFSPNCTRLKSLAFCKSSMPSETSTFLAIPCRVNESALPLNVMQISSGALQFLPRCSILCLQ